ncbi:hypothetical protein V6N11_054743 [Hibiscus sabdariffa]|uniref:RNase H type-1 domain-containing protein n=1 Tax=Hibiscus sabdariffa TaxID=183260 RepID=A0ABR2S4S3_9ROSI
MATKVDDDYNDMDMGYEDEPAETEIEEGAEEEEPSPTINNYGVDPATLSYVDSGGRLPGVVMPAVNHYSLEWPGSPVDLGVQSGTKKLREHDVSIVDSSVVGLGAGDSGVATMDGVEVLESSKGADLQRASRKSYADMVSAMRSMQRVVIVCLLGRSIGYKTLASRIPVPCQPQDSSEHVAVVSSIHSDQERPEELAFNEESLYEPWMVVDKCRRPPSRALTTNVEGTKRGGSRFAALSTVVEDVTPSRVTNLEVSNMRNLKKNGKLSAGANPLIDITNVPNKKDVGVTVISTIDGSVAHVMTHDLVIVAGSHKAFSIDEGNNENQTAARFRGSNQSADQASLDVLHNSLVVGEGNLAGNETLNCLVENRRVFELDFCERDCVLERSCCLLVETRRAIDSLGKLHVQLGASRPLIQQWTKPDPGVWKINVDGARDLANGRASCGGVIRDSNGLWVVGFSKYIGRCFVIEAEFWVVLEGLPCALRIRAMGIVLESDNSNVVRILRDNSDHGGVDESEEK